MKAVFDLLIPPVCLACHQRLDNAGDTICEECKERVALLTDDYCPKCGSPLEDHVCEACAEHSYSFDLHRSVFRYGDVVQNLIHGLKYNERRKVAGYFGSAMRSRTAETGEFDGFDYVMAVPLHRVRKRERGYNQSELLGKELAKGLGIPYRELVGRRLYTLSQTRLSKQQRERNLEGAFRLKRRAGLAGKNVIIVDDVFTTGTTVDRISKLLKDNGAAKVAVMTAARA